MLLYNIILYNTFIAHLLATKQVEQDARKAILIIFVHQAHEPDNVVDVLHRLALLHVASQVIDHLHRGCPRPLALLHFLPGPNIYIYM